MARRRGLPLLILGFLTDTASISDGEGVRYPEAKDGMGVCDGQAGMGIYAKSDS
jgi:hypothetical protein